MANFGDDVGHLMLQEQLKSRKPQYTVHIIGWGRQRMDTEFWQTHFLGNCHLEEEGNGRIMIGWIKSGQYSVQRKTSPIA